MLKMFGFRKHVCLVTDHETNTSFRNHFIVRTADTRGRYVPKFHRNLSAGFWNIVIGEWVNVFGFYTYRRKIHGQEKVSQQQYFPISLLFSHKVDSKSRERTFALNISQLFWRNGLANWQTLIPTNFRSVYCLPQFVIDFNFFIRLLFVFCYQCTIIVCLIYSMNYYFSIHTIKYL